MASPIPSWLALLVNMAVFTVMVSIGLMLRREQMLLGAACGGRDPSIRRYGAVAAAMRNPGLARLIATVNTMPATVMTAVFGCALGLTVVITAFVARQSRQHAAKS